MKNNKTYRALAAAALSVSLACPLIAALPLHAAEPGESIPSAAEIQETVPQTYDVVITSKGLTGVNADATYYTVKGSYDNGTAYAYTGLIRGENSAKAVIPAEIASNPVTLFIGYVIGEDTYCGASADITGKGAVEATASYLSGGTAHFRIMADNMILEKHTIQLPEKAAETEPDEEDAANTGGLKATLGEGANS
ncbi:MAG: hypothetical protein HUJ54_14690, partial [Erysipelotrichaceae bacterium]|nr:hypothetical protein [Erysipelotrichaceae bacterium]